MKTSPETQAGKTRILRERARTLAREPEGQQATGATLHIIEFSLANERYAFETTYVREVHPLENLTPLPGTPPFVAGIVNVRGRILAVIDIKKFFDLPEAGITDAHQVILLQAEDMEFGILADTVVGVRSIPIDALQPSLATFTGLRDDYLTGITAERMVMLDASRILTDPRIVVHEEVDT